MNILVVDDDTMICQTIKLTIDFLNHSCITTRSIDKAKKLLESNTFDLLILDIFLEEGDSSSLIEWLQVKKLEKPKIVLMSALTNAELYALRYKLQLLKKPFTLEELEKYLI